jgi:plasmid stabilization system protein ParE
MGQTKFKPLVLDEAQEDTKGLRRYIVKNFAAQTSEKTPAELTVAFANIRQFPQSRSAPAEHSDFGGLNFW